MIEDITLAFKRIERQKLSNKKYEVVYLKEYIYKDSTPNGIIKEYCNRIFKEYPGDKVFRITDPRIKNTFLNEANIQLNKALYNWSIYKRLVEKGLYSWGIVTLYYAQFYSIIGLLNLQGIAFPRPYLQTSSGTPKEIQFHVYPEHFLENKIVFEIRRLNKPHEDIWREYYNTYKGYRHELSKFNALYQYDMDNPLDPVKMRMNANYDVTFQFIEYLFTQEELLEFALKMQQNVFNLSQYDDENLYEEYIASLRINLLFDMLNKIMSTSTLSSTNEAFNRGRSEMMVKTKDCTVVPFCFRNWITDSA